MEPYVLMNLIRCFQCLTELHDIFKDPVNFNFDPIHVGRWKWWWWCDILFHAMMEWSGGWGIKTGWFEFISWTECKKLSGSRIAPEPDWIRYSLAIIIYFYRGICMRIHQPTAWIIDTEWRRKHWNKFKPPHRPSDGSTVDPKAVAARQSSSVSAIMRLREVRLKSTSFRYYRHLAIKFCRRQTIAWAIVFT